MSFSRTTRQAIIDILTNVMSEHVRKMTVTNPFNENEVRSKNPFGYRLAPIEVWKGSKFERSLVSKIGKNIFEKIAIEIARGTGANAEGQYSELLLLPTHRVEKIDEIVEDQRKGRRAPNWREDLEEILSLRNNRSQEVRVLFDVYIRRQNGTEEYYSFKTVKPNLDQTEIAKRDMLRLMAGKDNSEVYFALPYNPAGEGELYRRAKHTYPFKLFRMDEDPCVLIGSALWNKIGNDETTYNELLELFEIVGERFEDSINRDYFGIGE